MKTSSRTIALTATLIAAFLATGCSTVPGSKSESASSTKTTATTAAPVSKVGPGMNARGEVVDAKLVEAGYGQELKGINDYEGEITGKPAPGSKFTKLKIGMSLKQVTDIVGQPTDQGAHITGKAFIPFYFGSDRYRYETVYKGMGRLIFAGAAGFDSNAHLIWIIHSANEAGYR